MERYVLTGGPSSGKTSIILALENDWNMPVVREAAEDIIKLYQAKGIQEPWKLHEFQDYILELQVQREIQAKKAGYERVFIDRGILDGLAYYQIMDREPSEALQIALKKMQCQPYDKVFLIENLQGCETNEVRRENLEEALTLERMQNQNYQNFGYEIVKVLPLKLTQRVNMILDNV